MREGAGEERVRIREERVGKGIKRIKGTSQE